MDGKFLTADRCGAGKEDCLSLSELSLEQLVDALVIQIRVVVVHFFRVGAVVIDDIGRDPLTEVRLEAVHAHVEQDLKLVLEPFPCGRVREIHDRHAGLPHIPLPHLTVGASDKVTFFHAFPEKRGFLPDVGVDPHADIQPLVLDAL